MGNARSAADIKLPQPDRQGRLALEQSLDRRQSVRKYVAGPLSLPEVSQLLWAAQGTNKWAKHTAPSAGAISSLTVYLAAGEVEGLAPGLYRYHNKTHSLKAVLSQDRRASLAQACYNQSWVLKAPISIIIAANLGAISSRYGQRARRYTDIETGHVGQNLYLQATALNLGTVAVGAFSDEQVKEILAIDEEPLYIMPVGRQR
jgi:SagB-type dehydrogenase family enzyme